MRACFLTVFDMGAAAVWMIAAAVLLRLLLRKAPRALRGVLWAMVGIRLICPFAPQSEFSLMPAAPASDGLAAALAPALAVMPAESPDWLGMAAILWTAGAAVMLLYAIFSTVRLRRLVREAVPLRGKLWVCDRIDTPFIFGVVRPRIYLPSNLEEGQEAHVAAHENAHLARGDHWWKPIGFTLLALHWFNPFVWLAYVLFCRDIELACDERVIRALDHDGRRAYSGALLACSARSTIAACPLAFGEVGVAARVRAVLAYKKSAPAAIAAAVFACAMAAACFLTGYTQEIRLDGVIYTRRGAAVVELPGGSTDVGTLNGITHRTTDRPYKDRHAVNLDWRYAGNPLWKRGNFLYLQDYLGFYIPFVKTSVVS